MPLAIPVDDNRAVLFEKDDDSIAGDQNVIRIAGLLYGWNGTTWERVETDGSGNLKITL